MRIKDIFHNIMRLILPQKCLSCGILGEIICENCLYRLPKESSIYGITTIFAYSDPTVKKAIWLLKYKGIREVVKPFAKIIHERLLEDLAGTSELMLNQGEKILIVPAPLSKERLKERGFNQSEELARGIVNLDGGQSFTLGNNILIKTKNTPSQVSIKNRTKRIKNLRGVFALQNKAAARDKIIVLLDDVTTTGTTLSECARVLRRAKPRLIIKLALAH